MGINNILTKIHGEQKKKKKISVSLFPHPHHILFYFILFYYKYFHITLVMFNEGVRICLVSSWSSNFIKNIYK